MSYPCGPATRWQGWQRPGAHLAVVAAPHRHVWAAEGHEGSKGGQPAGIHKVSCVVQDVHINPQVPHLAPCR